MLSKENVELHLGRLGIAFRRKIDPRMADVYFRQLSRYLDDEQLANACNAVLEEDDRFPAIARLLGSGKSHRKRERGTPHLIDAAREDMGTLREVIEDLDAGRPIHSDELFRGRANTSPMVERLVYEDAVVTTPVVPTDALTDRLKRIAAAAEAEIARLEARATAHKGPSAPQDASK